MYISTPEVKALITRAFPDFNGKQIQVLPFCGPMILTSYWSGGYRNYYAFTPLETSHKVALVPENGTPYTREVSDLQQLPEGFALIRVTKGPRQSAVVYVNNTNLAKMLPAPIELSEDEKTVLRYTKSLKSSYAGIKNYRQVESGLSPERWEAAKQLCIGRGLLNKAGAITENGRNAVESAK